MLRSLAAILVAVLVGLTSAKFVEGAGMAAIGDAASIEQFEDVDESTEGAVKRIVSGSVASLLVFSWAFSSFVASALALFIGKRWAPVGWLAAMTIAFNALVSLLGATVPWWLWPFGILATVLGGFAAIKVLNASYAYPMPKKADGLFE